jgi:predicted small secreted protein
MLLQDASVLTHFLTSPFVTRSNLSLALSAYNTARVQKTGEVLKRAAHQCHIFEYHAEGTGRDVEKLRKAVDENTGAIVKWKVGEDIQKGLQWIESEARQLALKNQKSEGG